MQLGPATLWIVHGLCLDSALNIVEYTWTAHGSCMHYTMIIHGLLMEHVGRSLGPAWIMHGTCVDQAQIMNGVWADHAWILHKLGTVI